jgi:Cu+-exporting ATPase
MTCASCVALIEGRLRKRPGVLGARVALMAGQAEVSYDPTLVTPAAIVDAVNAIGFGATLAPPQQTRGNVVLTVRGLESAVAADVLAARLQALPGVHTAVVSLTEQTATVVFDADQLGPRDLIECAAYAI